MLNEWTLIQKATKEYAKCRNLSEVLRILNGDGYDLSYNRLFRRYKKYKDEFENAAEEYKKKVFEKTELDIDLEIQIFNSLVKMFNKINSILGNLPEDIDSKDINAISQLSNSLNGSSREISRLKDVMEKRLEWKWIKDNEVIEFCMQDPDLKPLIRKKKNEITTYLKKKRSKK